MTQPVKSSKFGATVWTVYQGQHENLGPLAGSTDCFAEFDTKKEAALYARYQAGKLTESEYEAKAEQIRLERLAR